MVLVVLCFETLGLSLLRTDRRPKEWSIKGVILKCIIAGSSNGSRGRSEQIALALNRAYATRGMSTLVQSSSCGYLSMQRLTDQYLTYLENSINKRRVEE